MFASAQADDLKDISQMASQANKLPRWIALILISLPTPKTI